MADVTIESIAIEITAAVGNADSALERLTKSLETLKSVCESGLNGADKVAKSLQKIADPATRIQLFRLVPHRAYYIERTQHERTDF